MSSEPEADFLDNELRNVFQDYNLPPAEHMHVWAGVAERIGSLPAQGRTGIPYRLVVPLATAALGVAVGWLLPRPDAQPVPPLAHPVVFSTTSRPVAPAAQPAVALVPLPDAATALAPAAVASAAPTNANATPAQPRWVKHHRPTARPTLALADAQPAAMQPAAATAAISDSTATAVVAPAPEAANVAPGMSAAVVPTAGPDSLPAVSKAATLAPAPSASHASPVAERPAKSLKPEGTNEKITYHKPTHRQTEQRGGIRRWFTRLGQSARHAVGL